MKKTISAKIWLLLFEYWSSFSYGNWRELVYMQIKLITETCCIRLHWGMAAVLPTPDMSLIAVFPNLCGLVTWLNMERGTRPLEWPTCTHSLTCVSGGLVHLHAQLNLRTLSCARICASAHRPAACTSRATRVRWSTIHVVQFQIGHILVVGCGLGVGDLCPTDLPVN